MSFDCASSQAPLLVVKSFDTVDRLKLAAHLDATVINKYSKDDLSNRRMYCAKVEDSVSEWIGEIEH